MRSQNEMKTKGITPNGKRGKSVFKTVFASLLAVLLLEVLLMLAAVYGVEIPQSLKRNAEQILTEQVENRAGYLNNYLLEAERLDTLFNAVSQKTEDALKNGTITLESLNNVQDVYELLGELSGDLLTVMRTKSVTGIFVVFNTRDMDTLPDKSTMPGIYLRDLDPDAPDSVRNEDISFEFAPVEVVHSMKVYTDTCWKPAYEYSAESGAFVYKPFQAAYKSGAGLSYDSYGYWTVEPFNLPGDTKDIITYSVPIILHDGTVCGVIGTEFQTSYIQSKLPYGELNHPDGAYMLSYTNEESSKYVLSSVITSAQNESTLNAAAGLDVSKDGNAGWTTVNGHKYYIYSVDLNLYSRNAPFSSDMWKLSAAVSRVQLYRTSLVVSDLFLTIALVMLLLGIAASLLISRRIAKPIRTLSGEIADFEKKGVNKIPQLSDTGIEEFDKFADAFTKLSRDVLDVSTRFLRIIEMASIEIGGYEVRRLEKKVYVTDNFFSMLGMPTGFAGYVNLEDFRMLMEEFYKSARIVSGSFEEGMVFAVSDGERGTRFILLRTTEEEKFQIGLVEDVTESELKRQRLEYDRDYDILTGLYNRSAFTAAMGELFQKTEVIGHGALFMFDIDNLKKINDTYGHDWGDKYIQLAGRYIKENLPKSAICSHFSGDEFFAFVYGLESEGAVEEIEERFEENCKKYRLEMPDGEIMPASVSCGIARFPDDSTDYKTLCSYADFAMYQVKHGEKGKMKLFDPEAYNRSRYEVQMSREFLQMLNDCSVQYHFQPIFSVRSGEPVAYEALMRVNKELLKSPADVMMLAHKLNKLYDVEKLTFSKSLAAYGELRKKHQVSGSARLFINSIPSVVLSDEDFNAVLPLMEELRGGIVVEITEAEQLDGDILSRKRKLTEGIAVFALDDYGSGYSNDANLLELSPDYIKIDYCIIHGIDSDKDKKQIVINIVSYAHQRGKKIIAEGIETAQELRCVIDLGVDFAQGFFLGRPAPCPKGISTQAMAVISDARNGSGK